MRRIVMWVMSTITIVVLLFGYHTSTSSVMASPGVVSASPAHGNGAGARAGSGTSAASKTITGPVVQTQWGPVQVQVTVDGSHLTDVQVLQHPAGNPTSDQINAYALPTLKQETLNRQSASIDMVSGATVTSTGYIQSLQAALNQAGV